MLVVLEEAIICIIYYTVVNYITQEIKCSEWTTYCARKRSSSDLCFCTTSFGDSCSKPLIVGNERSRSHFVIRERTGHVFIRILSSVGSYLAPVEGDGKVVSVYVMGRREREDSRTTSTHSEFRYQLEVSDQFYATTALPQWKQTPGTH